MKTLPLFTAAYALPQFDLVPLPPWFGGLDFQPPTRSGGWDYQHVVVDDGPTLRGDLGVLGSDCSNLALTVCELQQTDFFNVCNLACHAYCGPYEKYPNAPQTVACSLCRSQMGNCDDIRDQGVRACRKAHACSGGLVCTADIRNPNDYCCTAGDAPCGGMCGGGLCNGQCVPDLRTNPNHCGVCGNVCAVGRSCCGGQCVPDVMSNPKHCGACGHSCGPAETCCDGLCFDLLTDKEHCGTCTVACPPGGGSQCCSGQCRNLQNDNANCGGCGLACTAWQTCCGGPTEFAMGKQGECVSLGFNNANCGACGHVCPAGLSCCNGICRDLQSNINHCGKCLNPCPGVQVCSSGKCVCPPGVQACASAFGGCCAAGQICCDGFCKWLDRDPDHCGSCDKRCHGIENCVGGNCVCPDGQDHCRGECCPLGQKCCFYPGSTARHCIDPASDFFNCGGCGNSCSTSRGDKECRGGRCGCATPFVPCGSNCCGAGETCFNGQCALPCNTTQAAGKDTSDSRVINLGKNSGVFQFIWDTKTIPDLVEIWYEGRELLQEPCCQTTTSLYPTANTCVGTQGARVKNISYSGSSSFVTVKVFANCSTSQSTSGTEWEYLVGCPWDPFGP
jgi:hypothetical protein